MAGQGITETVLVVVLLATVALEEIAVQTHIPLVTLVMAVVVEGLVGQARGQMDAGVLAEALGFLAKGQMGLLELVVAVVAVVALMEALAAMQTLIQVVRLLAVGTAEAAAVLVLDMITTPTLEA
jgi:hypothetical protein